MRCKLSQVAPSGELERRNQTIGSGAARLSPQYIYTHISMHSMRTAYYGCGSAILAFQTNLTALE